MEKLKISENLKIGTATASLQVEGGDYNNSWFRWCELKKIKDQSHCKISCDHWNRIDEDIDLMKQLNCEVYRMSIEWSRIEPKKNNFNKDAIFHYRDEIKKMKEKGIEVMVTLHHFSNPLWLEDMGGWLNPEVIFLFERYTEYVVTFLGDIVSEWITINEPNIYCYNGYISGIWPPGFKNDKKKYLLCAKNMILAHIKSYRKIKEVSLNRKFQNPKVGVANHLRVFDPKKENFLNNFIIKKMDNFFHNIFIKGMTEGKFIPPLGNKYPYGKGIYVDFFGINYYTRDIINFCFDFRKNFVNIEVNNEGIKNDLNWEIYPEGLYRICKKYWEIYKIPIYITENGIADKDDTKRIKFIYDHLFFIDKLLKEGIIIQKYIHWTLMDNFEWAEGYTAKFGLIEVNFDNLKRTIRKSGYFFSDLIKYREITDEMEKKYF